MNKKPGLKKYAIIAINTPKYKSVNFPKFAGHW